MKINKAGIFITLIVIIFGGIAVADALGLWSTESTKEPVKITTGEFKGFSDPNDIRGSYTFADVERSFGVEVASLAEAFGIKGTDEEKAAYKCNGLEELYAGLSQEIGTDSVRLFVGLATGLPVDKGAYLLETASKWLRENVELSEEDKQYLSTHTLFLDEAGNEKVNESANVETSQTKTDVASVVTIAEDKVAPAAMETQTTEPETVIAADIVSPDSNSQAAEAEVEHALKEVGSVKGSTTIWDMIQWGVAREDIGPAIGIELPDDNGAKIRDLVIAVGKSFDEAKIILQEMIDKASSK